MAIGNIPARKRGFGYDPTTRSLGVYVDGALAASFPPSPGRTYFVNNVSGSSTNDGLSWANALDQVSGAITLSEAYRELGGVESGRTAITNDYVRNTIIVQGTGDYVGTEGGYDALTDLGEYYNLIGLGTPGAMGYGQGCVRLGKDTGETTGGMENLTGDYNGVYVANVQFQSGDASPAFVVRKLRRSMFEDCAFMVAPVVSGTLGAYFKLVTGGNAVTIRRCNCSGTAAITNRPQYGIDLGTATFFAASRIEQSHFTGFSAAFYNGSTQLQGQGTVVRDNVFGDLGHGVTNYGIYDLCNSTLATSGLITYVNNYLQATHPMYLYGTYERSIMNYCDNVVVTANL